MGKDTMSMNPKDYPTDPIPVEWLYFASDAKCDICGQSCAGLQVFLPGMTVSWKKPNKNVITIAGGFGLCKDCRKSCGIKAGSRSCSFERVNRRWAECMAKLFKDSGNAEARMVGVYNRTTRQ